MLRSGLLRIAEPLRRFEQRACFLRTPPPRVCGCKCSERQGTAATLADVPLEAFGRVVPLLALQEDVPEPAPCGDLLFAGAMLQERQDPLYLGRVVHPRPSPERWNG